MTSNAEAAEAFREIADLLDLLGERFKPEAYRRAARSIESLGEDLRSVAGRGALGEIPGVGEAIAEKIREYLREGRIGYRERLVAEVPPGIVGLLRLPGLGPKTARRFWLELGITGPEELAAALDAGSLDGVKGFGPRKIAQIREALGTSPSVGRIPLWEATGIARALLDGLRAVVPVERLEPAGSLRRARETVGDLDLLATTDDPPAVLEAFAHLPGVRTVRLRGETKETVLLDSGLQVDLRVVAPESFGAALQYFTGSKDHNVRLRTRARELGLKVNEYGVYREEVRIAGATEAEVYRSLGLPEIPPELREDRGEIEQAEAGQLPKLVQASDLKGDLHVHLPEENTPGAWAALFDSVRSLGHRYVGLAVPFDTPAEQLAAGRRRAAQAAGSTILYWGLEGPIPEAFQALPEGFDYARALPGASTPAPTSGPPPDLPKVPRELRIVSHLPLLRPGSTELDLGTALAWIRWAASAGAALEIPPTAGREGLDSVGARTARERGVTLTVTGLSRGVVDPLRWGVAVALARRAGLEPASIRNAAEQPDGPRALPANPTRRRGKGSAGAPEGRGPGNG